jgi:hypothetical protein
MLEEQYAGPDTAARKFLRFLTLMDTGVSWSTST